MRVFWGGFGAYQRKTRARDGVLEGPAFGWLRLASKEVQGRVKMAVLGQFGLVGLADPKSGFS